MNISISLPNGISVQTILIVIGVLIVIFAFIRIVSGRRRGRRTTRRPGTSPRSRLARPKRRDHGREIAKRHGHERSPEWPRVEKEHLLHEPACVACGYKGHGLQVHHIKPFHLHPTLELDPRNLITLCEIKGRDHHLLLGHLDEWESYNVNVRDDSRRYHGKSALQIRADRTWQKEVAMRPK